MAQCIAEWMMLKRRGASVHSVFLACLSLVAEFFFLVRHPFYSIYKMKDFFCGSIPIIYRLFRPVAQTMVCILQSISVNATTRITKMWSNQPVFNGRVTSWYLVSNCNQIMEKKLLWFDFFPMNTNRLIAFAKRAHLIVG